MWRKLFGGAERRRALKGLDEEIHDHIDREAEVNLARGMTPDEARRQARLAFGNVTLVREDARAAWTIRALEQSRQDVRYALRTLRKSPGFALVAILTLSLGISANTAIYTLIDALMLRSLPVSRPDQLLQISMTADGARESINSDSLSYPVVRVLAEQRDLFAGLGGFSTFTFDAGPPDNVRRTPGAFVTGGFYEAMGLAPAAGRLLTPDDDQRDAPLVAVVTYGFWERAFARDPRIIGQPYMVNGRAVTIVGVTPPGFTGAHVGWIADLTLPASAVAQVRPELATLLGPGNIWLRVLARPRTGTSLEQAAAALTVRWPQLSPAAIAPTFTAERRAGWSEKVTIDGRTQEREPAFLAVSPKYFETLQVALRRGRVFSASDQGSRATVAIVNERFAERYFPGQDPLGQHFTATVGQPEDDLEIVGVVSDVIANDLRAAPPPTVYVPYFQVQVMSQNFSTLQVRATGSLAPLFDAIRRELQGRMAGTPVEIRLLSAQVDSASVRERLVTTLASGLGAVALVLAAIGLYGLLAYNVAARSKEIGIRVALGAKPRNVFTLVLRQGVGLVGAGILIGITGAAALSRLVEGMLFGLTPLDPMTFIGVSGLLAAVALAASGIPARRATRVDPLVSIRAE